MNCSYAKTGTSRGMEQISQQGQITPFVARRLAKFMHSISPDVIAFVAVAASFSCIVFAPTSGQRLGVPVF